MEITLCTPESIYIIVEKVYTTITTARIGPSLRKVTRHVSQVCNVEDVYYDGQRLDSMPGGWQLLMDALGFAELSTRPTGETRLTLVYAGFENLLRPLPEDLDTPHLPQEARDALFSEHRLPSTGLYTYGTDPIPDIRLFGNPSVQFTTAGGDDAPTAIAIHHGSSGRLEVVPPAQRDIMLQQFQAAG